MSLKAFNIAIDLFAKNLTQKELVLFQKKIVFQFLVGVVDKTPVDTGYARGNWHTSVNKTSDVIHAGIRGAEVPVSEANAIMAFLRPFSVVYITNNVPYIMALEEGHSSQTGPNVMIAGTLEKIRQQFE